VGEGRSLNSVRLFECLHLVPSLSHFEAWWPGCHRVVEFSIALAESPSLLPNLRTLIIHLHWSDLLDVHWRTLLRALSGRRTQIQVFRLKVNYVTTPPWPDILAAFRELVVDGMDVYIGTYDDEDIIFG